MYKEVMLVSSSILINLNNKSFNSIYLRSSGKFIGRLCGVKYFKNIYCYYHAIHNLWFCVANQIANEISPPTLRNFYNIYKKRVYQRDASTTRRALCYILILPSSDLTIFFSQFTYRWWCTQSDVNAINGTR